MLAAGAGDEKRRSGLLATARGRRLLFAALYFGEGAPIGFLWWTLPVLLRREGVEVERIGALSALLVLPWSLKFLWAPLVDLARSPRFSLRGWIACSQAAMAATLLPVAFVPLEASGALLPLLLAHATAAATQDVAIDALAIRHGGAGERGSLNGWMQAGMLLGRGIFGGAVLLLHERGGTRAIVLALCAVLGSSMALHALYRAPFEGRRSGALAEFASALRRAAARRSTWLVLAFAATSGAAFEVVGSLAGSFLVDEGHGDDAIALFFGLVTVVCLASGALAGGRLADRFGHPRVVACAGALLVACAGTLALAGDAAWLAWGALGATYLAAGGFTASTYALFMAVTDPRLAATQFSATMGATNLCEAWSARVGGLVAGRAGYASAFGAGALASALALFLLLGLRALPTVPASDR